MNLVFKPEINTPSCSQSYYPHRWYLSSTVSAHFMVWFGCVSRQDLAVLLRVICDPRTQRDSYASE